MTAQNPQSALATWRERLEYFQRGLAIVSPPAMRYELEKQIEEAQQKIAELEKEVKRDSQPSNLLYSGTLHFVGRDKTLKELHKQLQQNNQLAICAVSGMGGIGKIELAVQYALRHQDEYPGGLCWLQCRSGDLGTQITNYGRSLLSLVIPDGLDLPAQVAYCWGHWRKGTVLLIYDDVVDYAAIAPYLPPRNKGDFKVLMTSRQRAGSNYKRIDLDVLGKDAALELLRSLVGVERINAQLKQAEELCEWLGYLPLGIEMVGRYLAGGRALTLETVQKRLNGKSIAAKALIERKKGDTTAQLGVAAAFELSWSELSELGKKLGCRLSLFASAPIHWLWVEQCVIKIEDEEEREEEQEELEEVRNQGLIERNLLQINENSEYQLHPLIREFFRAKQEEIENIDECRKDLCRVMVEIAKGIPDTVTLSAIAAATPAVPHWKEVAGRLMEWVEDKDLIWFYVRLGSFYQGQSTFHEAEKWYRQSVEVIQSRLGELHPDVANSYNNLAGLYETMGRYGEAESLYDKALEIRLEQLGEAHPDVATSHNNLALLYKSMGRYGEAIAHYGQAIEIAMRTLGKEHPNTRTIQNNYYRMLFESPEEEILKALPEEKHEDYRQTRQEWESDQAQENPEE